MGIIVGVNLLDKNGKEYIDLATGIAVNSFGVSDPAWVRAVTEQLCTVQHTSNLYFTAPDAQLAQLLCEKTGMKKVFFSNSGAEANECAIKAARKYAAEHKGPEYHTIITLKNSFHGRTITTLAATGQDVFHHDFLPLTEGFAYAEANDLDDPEFTYPVITGKYVLGENVHPWKSEPIVVGAPVVKPTPIFAKIPPEAVDEELARFDADLKARREAEQARLDAEKAKLAAGEE